MSFKLLKRYLPRGLYGRAMLILLLPVVSVALVVLVVFIQRHFEGVTRQMTHTVSREIRILLNDPSQTAAEIAQSRNARVLQIDAVAVDPADVPVDDFSHWYDLTGGIVIREFNKLFYNLKSIQLPDERRVLLYFNRPDGPILISFDRRRASASNPHQLIVNMLVFGVLMTVISYFYLRNQIRPITRLAKAAEAFGRGRNEPYKPSGALEVRAAGNAFLDMRSRIERQIEQRTLMLSGVSHDLRTPLTRLKLGLSMLDDPSSKVMQQDVQDMERLLDEFLDFARGAQEGNPVPTDPIVLVQSIVEDCKRANMNVRLLNSEGAGEVSMRSLAIRRAIENLINNAIRYGAKAEVSVYLTNKTLRIQVEDDGPGIPDDQRSEAVKPFVRLEPARNQNLGSGVGLGLSISLDIARAHGGALRLDQSDRLGGLSAEIVIAR